MHIPSFCRNALPAWIAAALGFVLPFSTAGANFMLLLLLIVWLILPGRRERLCLFWQNPVARLALFLFLALALGCLWGEAPWEERGRILFKYFDLILIGLLAGLLPQAQQRERALSGLLLGMTLLLLLSLAIWLGILPEGFFGKYGSGAVVMKHSITHNWLMACFMLFCLILAAFSKRLIWQRTLLVIASLAGLNVLFMVGGRTGYVVLILLLAYAFLAWKGWRGLIFASVALIVVGTITLAVPNRLSTRINEAVREVQHWKPGEGAKTSQGFRLDWYRASVQLIAEKPVAGVGTGSFPAAMARHLAGSPIVAPSNPHNEYLLLAVQLGLPGLFLLLLLFGGTWHAASNLEPRERHLLRGTILAMSAGCLFNSFLLDFVEGMFFAWVLGVLCAGLTVGKKNAALTSRV